MKTAHPKLLPTLAGMQAFPAIPPYDPPVILELEQGLGCSVRDVLPEASEASWECALHVEYLHTALHDDRYLSATERTRRRRALENGV